MCIETQPAIEDVGIIFIDRGRYFFFKKSTNLSKLHVICIMRNRATFNMPTPPPLLILLHCLVLLCIDYIALLRVN